jgi:hypothetical protein
LVAGVLAGCASVQPISAPPNSPAPIRAHISLRLPTLQEKFGAATDLPNSYFGVSGAQGSVILGLFGPLGMLANMAHVQSTNEKAAPAFAQLSSMNLADVLREVDGNLRVSRVPHSGEYSIVPAGRIVILDERKFVVTCLLNVEYNANTDKPWRAYYEVNPDVVFEITDSQHKSAVASTLRRCFQTAMGNFYSHIDGTIGGARLMDIKLSNATLRMPVYVGKLPGRVIGNNGFGLQEFKPSEILKVE